jgi:hypothetical protein
LAAPIDMKRVLVSIAALSLVSCGPRSPGPHGGELIYWRVTTSDVAFASCSDAPSFRDPIKPVEVTGNTYLIYKTAADNKTATSQRCESFDRASCRDTEPQIVFTVAGNQLFFTTEKKTPLIEGQDAGCQLNSVQQWTLSDKGENLDAEITNTLSEVDSETMPNQCAADEESIKTQSPNKTGLNGCVVTFTMQATIKQ